MIYVGCQRGEPLPPSRVGCRVPVARSATGITFCLSADDDCALPAWMDGGGNAGQGVAYFKFDMYGIVTVPVST
jgi:hypothetical protein